MKYSAKRTWPDKAQSWEHQGEADTIDAFAAEFATIEQLRADAEFVVMTREGANTETRFFRVASGTPVQLVPAQARSGAEQASVASAPEQAAHSLGGEDAAESDAAPFPSIQPVISMFWYMGKVAIIATLAIAAMIPVVSILKRALGD